MTSGQQSWAVFYHLSLLEAASRMCMDSLVCSNCLLFLSVIGDVAGLYLVEYAVSRCVVYLAILCCAYLCAV